MGADIYWGHSNHIPQGIEIYKQNKIIMYDCGDFIDDYAVDPMYRNDLSFIFLLNLVYSDDDDGDDDDSNNHEDNGYGVINHDSSENKRSKSGNDSNYYSNNYYFSTEKNDDGINTNHHSKYIIKDVELIPTKIYDFKVNTLLDNESDIAIRRMIKRCSYHGTKCIVTDKGDKKKRVIKIRSL
jgi:hypothetical protein